MHSPGNQPGTVDKAVSLQINATDSAGKALTYRAQLPPGLTIGSSSGLISGTPTAAGTFESSITATDASGHSGSAAFTWTISPQTVTVTCPGDQINTVGDAVSLQCTASDSAGETLTFTDSGTLPPGLVIGSSSGLISGSPTTAGTYPVTIMATDTSGITGSATLTWTVNAPTPTP